MGRNLLQNIFPSLEFLAGYVCAGESPHGTLVRPEDQADTWHVRHAEMFGAKLYFRDVGIRKGKIGNDVCISITARVRNGEVIALRVRVRTNSMMTGGMDSYNRANFTHRAYEEGMGGWGAAAGGKDEFLAPVGRTLAIDLAYHESLHFCVRNFCLNPE